jgi:hypothetical protein
MQKLLRLRDEIARFEERSELSDNSRSQENKICLKPSIDHIPTDGFVLKICLA